MLIGYLFIIAAAVCWGLSATWARHLILENQATPLLLSQTRVLLAWAILAVFTAVSRPRLFKIAPRDLGTFLILGLVGIAGANYFLYRAIGQMNAALADLIQFTAPIIVVVWMSLRGKEPMDRPKIAGLSLALVGCALALGLTGSIPQAVPVSAVISAAISAVCFSVTLILGKSVSGRYSLPTYLNFSLLSASVFWFLIIPPWQLAGSIPDLRTLATLTGFAVTSILLPYVFFFSGLKRVPASRASIVSTFEPVVVALGSWIFLSESLTLLQVAGIMLVCAAIVIVEVTTRSHPAANPDHS